MAPMSLSEKANLDMMFRHQAQHLPSPQAVDRLARIKQARQRRMHGKDAQAAAPGPLSDKAIDFDPLEEDWMTPEPAERRQRTSPGSNKKPPKKRVKRKCASGLAASAAPPTKASPKAEAKPAEDVEDAQDAEEMWAQDTEEPEPAESAETESPEEAEEPELCEVEEEEETADPAEAEPAEGAERAEPAADAEAELPCGRRPSVPAEEAGLPHPRGQATDREPSAASSPRVQSAESAPAADGPAGDVDAAEPDSAADALDPADDEAAGAGRAACALGPLAVKAGRLPWADLEDSASEDDLPSRPARAREPGMRPLDELEAEWKRRAPQEQRDTNMTPILNTMYMYYV